MADIQNTDFSFKPNVDMVGIASLMQKKRIAEIEAKQQARAQKFQELGQTINLATGLASTMVENSRKRQIDTFQKAQAESLAAMVPQQITKFDQPKTLSSMVPPMSSVANPQIEKQDMVRNAALNAPDEAAKTGLKLAFPETATNKSASQLVFQRHTLPDSKGNDKPISVGYLGTQAVNPLTLQPFNGTPEEVDKMPAYGFVERSEFIGTDENNNPVYYNSIARRKEVELPDGTRVPHMGKFYPKLENPSAGAVDKLAFIQETRDILKDAVTNFKPAFVGPMAGRIAPMKEWVNELTDEQQVEFNQMMLEIDSIKRHQLYGSALSVGEQAFFNGISLNTRISPKAFLARVEAAGRKLDTKERALRSSQKQSGRTFRDVGGSESTPKSTNAGDLGDGFSFTVEP